MNRIFSGVQPTGNLHLGNYLGAIRNWVALQNEFDCIFCIVDLHALTQPQDPAQLRAQTREVTAAYIAAGIDPERCIIFNQSMVPGHSELAWLLSCFTPLGWLNRMTQFKEKAGKQRDNASLGLYRSSTSSWRAISPAPSTDATASSISPFPSRKSSAPRRAS